MMYQTLEALQDYIKANFNSYVPDGMSDIYTNDVLISEIDTDKYKPKLMIHITFDGATYEEDTLTSDSVTLSPEIYLIHRGYDKNTLMANVIKYADTFIEMIRSDSTLGNEVDMCAINNIEYFQGVGADENIKAVKITLTITYEDIF